MVPGEVNFYLRAGSPHERQEWLVALGSVKSCINTEKASKGTCAFYNFVFWGSSTRTVSWGSKNTEGSLVGNLKKVRYSKIMNFRNRADFSLLGIAEEEKLRRKHCELRLYCDLLVQQVHSIKGLVVNSPIPDVKVRYIFSLFKNDTQFFF